MCPTKSLQVGGREVLTASILSHPVPFSYLLRERGPEPETRGPPG